MDGLALTPEEQKTFAEITKKKSMLIQQHRIKKSTAESRPTVPRKFDKDRKYTTKRMGRQLSDMGIDPTRAINRARTRSKSVTMRGRKRERSIDGGDAMDMDTNMPNKKLRMRSASRSRSSSRPPTEVVPGDGFKDSDQKAKAIRKGHKTHRMRNKNSWISETDRVIPNLKQKNLLSGKRSNGKTHRR